MRLARSSKVFRGIDDVRWLNQDSLTAEFLSPFVEQGNQVVKRIEDRIIALQAAENAEGFRWIAPVLPTLALVISYSTSFLLLKQHRGGVAFGAFGLAVQNLRPSRGPFVFKVLVSLGLVV